MTVFRTLVAGIFAAALASAPAIAGPHHDGPRGMTSSSRSAAGRSATPTARSWTSSRAGRCRCRSSSGGSCRYMPGADYLGPELNGGTYRLKFMQNGRVIWVDVDSQTGRIIRRSR